MATGLHNDTLPVIWVVRIPGAALIALEWEREYGNRTAARVPLGVGRAGGAAGQDRRNRVARRAGGQVGRQGIKIPSVCRECVGAWVKMCGGGEDRR